MACVVAVLIWIASIDNPLYTPGEYSHGNGGTGMLEPFTRTGFTVVEWGGAELTP